MACRLQGWTSADPIITSPQYGHLFENLVFAELHKLNINFQLGWNIHHWRSKDKEEIDFIIEKPSGEFVFIEAKVSPHTPPDLAKFREVQKVFGSSIPKIYVCHQEGERLFNKNFPISMMKNILLDD